MYPRPFEYVAASSLDEALTALDANEGAKVLAGGMSLLQMMKLRLFSPPTLIDIGGIDSLRGIEDAGDHITIGALVTSGEVAASPLVQEHAHALSQAASWTGDVQVRNRGTCCGVMAHADTAADQTAAAIAVGATMIAQSAGGTREVAAPDFFVDALQSALEPNEILTSLRIPKSGGASRYDKLGRRGGHSDYAVAGAAAWVKMDGGSVAEARVALTGVGTKAMLAAGSTEAILGSDGGADAIAAAAARATEGVTVLEDLYGSEEYKAHLASVYVRRALEQAVAAG